MRTLVLSDLHLGSLSGSDLLRNPQLRAPLLAAAAEAERVVLLGDVLELRHGPPREALAAARAVIADLGRALAGRELVIVPGNHDHALIEPWLALRAARPSPESLGLEQLLEPAEASPLLAVLAAPAPQVRVRAADPGLWLRPDVYATHGHFLDCHLTVPTVERLSMGVMCRVLGRPAGTFHSVEDYEAVTGPVYAWRDATARHARTGAALNGLATVRAWQLLGGAGDGASAAAGDSARNGPPKLAARLRRGALVRAFPLAVAALNRAGIGPLHSEISGVELRRAALRAMGEVVTRLQVQAGYVVFGHTHRCGPLPGDDVGEWEPRAGLRLINAGCWTYEPTFLRAPAESPYWPGACVSVEDAGQPRLQRLLLERTHEELRRARRASRASAPRA